VYLRTLGLIVVEGYSPVAVMTRQLTHIACIVVDILFTLVYRQPSQIVRLVHLSISRSQLEERHRMCRSGDFELIQESVQ